MTLSQTSVRLVPTWRDSIMSAEAAGEVLMPDPGVRIAPTTFDQWLKTAAIEAS